MSFAISVPVGAWNDFLPFTLESLRRQSAQLEVALLDASADPRVRELADKYDDILNYRRHGPDRGQSDAILEGWANTDGTLLAWLNADDSLFPGALARVLEVFETNPGPDVVYGQSTIVDRFDRMTGYHYNVEPPGPRLKEGCIISQPSCFFRRSAYGAVGGLNRDLHYVMDWDLWLRLYETGAHFEFIAEPLSRVLWGNETKSASFNRGRRRELRQIIESFAPPEKQKEIFNAFAVHTFTDLLWPPALKRMLAKKLHSVGQVVNGVRADGLLSEQATLFLVHYQQNPAYELALRVEGIQKGLRLTVDNAEAHHTEKNGFIHVRLDRPAEAGDLVRLNIDRSATKLSEMIYFRSADWVFDKD